MELSALTEAGQLGIGALAVIILGALLLKVNKDNNAAHAARDQTFSELIRADMALRERQTTAMVAMAERIQTFNQVDGQNQATCAVIREAFSENVQEMGRTAQTLTKGLETLDKIIEKGR